MATPQKAEAINIMDARNVLSDFCMVKIHLLLGKFSSGDAVSAALAGSLSGICIWSNGGLCFYCSGVRGMDYINAHQRVSVYHVARHFARIGEFIGIQRFQSSGHGFGWPDIGH
ncbi:hypothetical protein D3C76_1562670 [compost metagenome]